MNLFVLPDILVSPRPSLPYFHLHTSTESNKKAKLHFTCHCISIVLNGSIQINSSTHKEVINLGSAILYGQGNYLSYETQGNGKPYQSLLIFFNPENILSLQSHIVSSGLEKRQPYLTITNDHFILGFINDLSPFLNEGKHLDFGQTTHQLRRLLHYFIEKKRSIVESVLFAEGPKVIEAAFIQTIEDQLSNNLTIEEIAFLCQMSESTFKRQFVKSFGESPAKWQRKKRLLNVTKQMKLGGKKLNQLYMLAGYADYSSFSYAFKSEFGLSPREYLKRK